jgi:hypothetical protein
MNIRGQGDRWLAGEPIQGVQFEHNAPVEIVGGPHAGQTGSVAFLMNLDADPLYLVELGTGAGDIRVRQSSLRAGS